MTTGKIEPGDLVVVHCVGPKEKIWGELVRLDATGLVVRGLDLASVDDWLRQERRSEPPMITATTLFFPTHRLERIYLDQSTPAVPSFGDRYRTACQRDPRDALAGREE